MRWMARLRATHLCALNPWRDSRPLESTPIGNGGHRAVIVMMTILGRDEPTKQAGRTQSGGRGREAASSGSARSRPGSTSSPTATAPESSWPRCPSGCPNQAVTICQTPPRPTRSLTCENSLAPLELRRRIDPPCEPASNHIPRNSPPILPTGPTEPTHPVQPSPHPKRLIVTGGVAPAGDDHHHALKDPRTP